MGIWAGDFFFEITDHFGLDKPDVIKFQDAREGFAAWWILQHKKAYRPFITKLRFVTLLKGKI